MSGVEKFSLSESQDALVQLEKFLLDSFKSSGLFSTVDGRIVDSVFDDEAHLELIEHVVGELVRSRWVTGPPAPVRDPSVANYRTVGLPHGVMSVPKGNPDIPLKGAFRA